MLQVVGFPRDCAPTAGQRTNWQWNSLPGSLHYSQGQKSYRFTMLGTPIPPATHPAAPAPIGAVVLGAAAGVVSLYMALGYTYNSKRHGLSGRAALPNRYFWTEVPSLVKDGCMFSITKCLRFRVKWVSSGSYENL